MDRAGIAQMLFLTGCCKKGFSLIRQQRMYRGYDRHIGAEIAVVADSDFRIILDGQVEIDENTFSDLRMFSIVECDRTLDKQAFAGFSQDLVQDGLPFLGLIFIRLVVIHVQVVGPQLDGHQFRVGRAEQDAGSDLFFFSHDRFPFLWDEDCILLRSSGIWLAPDTKEVPAEIISEMRSESMVQRKHIDIFPDRGYI